MVVVWFGDSEKTLIKRPAQKTEGCSRRPWPLTGGAVILAIFLGDTTVNARSRAKRRRVMCPGALLHLGVMLLWCLQKSRVRGCASKQCAALPPPPQRRSPRRWRKN